MRRQSLYFMENLDEAIEESNIHNTVIYQLFHWYEE